jgi:hypothetical protein
MMEYHCLNVSKDVYKLELLPRGCGLCERCGDQEAERHVQSVIAGEQFDEQLCDMCADKAIKWKPEVEPVPRQRPAATNVSSRVLERARRTADYRGSWRSLVR